MNELPIGHLAEFLNDFRLVANSMDDARMYMKDLEDKIPSHLLKQFDNVPISISDYIEPGNPVIFYKDNPIPMKSKK